VKIILKKSKIFTGRMDIAFGSLIVQMMLHLLDLILLTHEDFILLTYAFVVFLKDLQIISKL
jgi:hypothetical protein